MKPILIIAFLFLFAANYHICDMVYPDSSTIESEWYKWDDLRRQIYEVMFLLAIIISFLSPTRLSKALSAGGILLIGMSVIDKVFQSVFSYHVHDIIVITASVFIAGVVYKRLQ